jgi:hypothetical protein
MAAAGIVAEPTQLLAELVASSPAFQAAVGAADEAEALARVHQVTAKSGTLTRPFAIVSMVVAHQIRRGGFGSGDLVLLFEMAVDPAYARQPADDGDQDLGPATEAIRNWAGAVVEEMMLEQENGGRLIVRGINQEGPIIRSPKGADVDFFQLCYRVQWGAVRRS